MANNELKWSADEIADACVKAGLGILECHGLMITLKATPPATTPAQAELSGALPELRKTILDVLIDRANGIGEDHLFFQRADGDEKRPLVTLADMLESAISSAYAKQAIEARGALSDAADAARYRWMRKAATFGGRDTYDLRWYLPRYGKGDVRERLDAAIDAAIHAQAGEGAAT